MMDELAKTVLSASRGISFRRRPIFEPYKSVSRDELPILTQKVGIPIPGDLQEWLLTVGYGDLGDELSFREEWFAAIKNGQLKGGIIFSQDILGNFYAFDLHGEICYLSRFQSVFAKMADDFAGFINELIGRDYKLLDWVETLNAQTYDW